MRPKDRNKVMNKTDKDIGQVTYKSEIDSSKKPIPKEIPSAMISSLG